MFLLTYLRIASQDKVRVCGLDLLPPRLNGGRLKMRELKMRHGQKCKGGKCESRQQGWKMQE